MPGSLRSSNSTRGIIDKYNLSKSHANLTTFFNEEEAQNNYSILDYFGFYQWEFVYFIAIYFDKWLIQLIKLIVCYIFWLIQLGRFELVEYFVFISNLVSSEFHISVLLQIFYGN